MSSLFQFLRDNVGWVVPIATIVLSAIGWLVRRLFKEKSAPHQAQSQQAQKVTGRSVGIQAGGDVVVHGRKDAK
jgi:flagellar biogenesis protein FliO